jgi:hypothetical protein
MAADELATEETARPVTLRLVRELLVTAVELLEELAKQLERDFPVQ